MNGEVSDEDTRFLNITIDVLHTGENLNKSNFSKEVVDEAVDSIKNNPVLGFIKYSKLEDDDDDFAGHENILVRTKNGIEEKYIGSCYGVVPESCNPRWTVKMCKDGVEREFLQVDALMWQKFEDAVDIVERDGEKSQSMELELSSIEGYEEDGVFYFEKFRFDGLCILGEDVEPAMVDANVKIKEFEFAKEEFTKNIQDELNDKFSKFAKLIGEGMTQGGVRNMPEKDFAQTVMQQFGDIAAIAAGFETVKDRWGYEYSRFSAVDIQEDEVIVVDANDNYNYYGFKFTVNGDKPEIDFACGKRKKVRYEDYAEGSASPEGAFEFGAHIAKIEEAAFAKVEEADAKLEEAVKEKDEAEAGKAEVEAEFGKVQAELDEIKPKYEEFIAAEEVRVAEALNAEKDAKFAEFEDILAENAEFSALKEKKDEMSVDDIEKECAVLYVKVNRGKQNYSKQSAAGSSAVGIIEGNEDHAGIVRTKKYGDVHIGR